jgi:hypothetical protein
MTVIRIKCKRNSPGIEQSNHKFMRFVSNNHRADCAEKKTQALILCEAPLCKTLNVQSDF